MIGVHQRIGVFVGHELTRHLAAVDTAKVQTVVYGSDHRVAECFYKCIDAVAANAKAALEVQDGGNSTADRLRPCGLRYR